MGIRLQDIFKYDKQIIHIIGCGATGSNLAYQLIKSECELHLWDDDIVNSQNIGNQFFTSADISVRKTNALKERLTPFSDSSIPIHTHNTQVTEKNCKFLSGYIFICVDKMDTRKMLWDNLKNNPNIKLIIDIRMGIDIGRIYTVNFETESGKKTYEESLYSSDKVASLHLTACYKTSVGSTAIGLCSYAVWVFYNTIANHSTPHLIEMSFENPDLVCHIKE